MFPAEKKGEWEPYRVREKKVEENGVRQPDGQSRPDIEMGDGSTAPNDHPKPIEPDEEPTYEEDPLSDEGAVYPIQKGRVQDWSCFFALLTHVYNMLSPPFHTPILLVAQPAWTAKDLEELTLFFFEKFKTPAFCMMDSALAVGYAYGLPTATVIDVGFEKVDVTAVSDFVAHDVGRGVAIAGCGGEWMTQRLLELLGPKGFTRDMCEQLKKSSICEILPQGSAMPGSTESTVQDVSNPAAAAATGADGSGPGQRNNAAALGEAPRGPGLDTQVGEDGDDIMKEDEEGILDVASIVASGKTSEFLARKEREKAEKAAAKKVAADAAATAKTAKLPNSKKERNTFVFEERRSNEDLAEESRNENGKRGADIEMQDGGDQKRQKTPEAVPEAPVDNVVADESAEAARRQQEKFTRKEERRKMRQSQSDSRDVVRREVEVGVERFMAATGGILEAIVDAIHRAILSVEEVGKRGELWDSLVILGNGSKVKGLSGDPPAHVRAPSLIT